MLVLSRRVGDEITLPELGVTIRLLDLRGKVAKVGVKAPRELSILRGELAFEQSPEAISTSNLHPATA